MKKYIISVIAGLGLCLAGFAFGAGDQFAKPTPRLGGVVVGGEIGYGELNTVEPFEGLADTLLSPTNFSSDLGDFVWGVHLGYDYQMAKTGWLSHVLLGAEVGYKDLGESTYKASLSNAVVVPFVNANVNNASLKTNYESQAIDQLLVAHVYIWQGWNVFAKAGLAELYTDYTVKGSVSVPGVPTASVSESNTTWNLRPEYELGTGYTFIFTPEFHMDVYALYDHISTEPLAGGTADALATGGMFVNVPGANMVMGGVSLGFNPMV